MCRMPFVFLELKGAAYNTDAIDWIWAEVLELGLVNHVALYVMDDEQPSMLAQQTHWQGLLIRGFWVQHPLCSLAAHSVCILESVHIVAYSALQSTVDRQVQVQWGNLLYHSAFTS